MRLVDLYGVMRVAGQVRAFRPDPLPDSTISRVLEHARFAPNGGNRQGWRVIVVTDGERRRALRDFHLAQQRAYVGSIDPGGDSPGEKRQLAKGADLRFVTRVSVGL